MQHGQGWSGVTDADDPTTLSGMREDGRKIAYAMGRYDQCAVLLTSPRFNRPQRELIEGIAYQIKDELEALGVKFGDRG